jgi:glycosyltransferase involved in cell wall biosynthesis
MRNGRTTGTTQPLVSVVIPTFNRAYWVGEAIQSVLAQAYPRLELIVIDDGSDDHTHDVVQGFGPTLTYLWQEHRGVSAARNRGVEASHGDLLAFLDSDDLWLPEKVAAQASLLQQQPQLQACYTDEVWIRRGVRVNPKRIHQKVDGWLFLQSLPRCIISPSSIMLRRSLWDRLGGFDEGLPACEDYDLWLRLTVVVPVALLPQRLIVKRGGHADQLSRCIPMLDQYRIMALDKLLRTSLTVPQRQAVLQQLVQKCGIMAQGAHKRGHDARAACYQARAQRYRQQLVSLVQVTTSA